VQQQLRGQAQGDARVGRWSSVIEVTENSGIIAVAVIAVAVIAVAVIAVVVLAVAVIAVAVIAVVVLAVAVIAVAVLAVGWSRSLAVGRSRSSRSWCSRS
jgi:hypothetical protein